MPPLLEALHKAQSAGIVGLLDESRLARKYRKILREPGDCAGDDALLIGIAIADCAIGIGHPGSIVEIQNLGCNIAELIEQKPETSNQQPATSNQQPATNKTGKPTMRHFVKRSYDGAIQGKNGRWYRMFADVYDIKFYKRLRNADKYGLRKISDKLYRPELGNLESIGTIVTVRENQIVDVCGNVHDID